MIAAFILFLKLLLQHQTFLKSFAVTGGFALTRVLNAADIFLFPNSAIAHQRGGKSNTPNFKYGNFVKNISTWMP